MLFLRTHAGLSCDKAPVQSVVAANSCLASAAMVLTGVDLLYSESTGKAGKSIQRKASNLKLWFASGGFCSTALFFCIQALLFCRFARSGGYAALGGLQSLLNKTAQAI